MLLRGNIDRTGPRLFTPRNACGLFLRARRLFWICILHEIPGLSFRLHVNELASDIMMTYALNVFTCNFTRTEKTPY